MRRAGHTHGAVRAWRHAGAAAGTARAIQHRYCNSACPQRKTNCPGFALIAANAAFDASLRQTLFANCCLRQPRQLACCTLQGVFRAGGDAVTTEGAFPRSEINHRIAGVMACNYLRRTNTYAISATSTGAQEIIFCKCPRRSQGFNWGGKATEKEVAAAGWIGHSDMFFLSVSGF